MHYLDYYLYTRDKYLTYMWCDGEIESNTTGFQTHEENPAIWVLSEFLNSSIPGIQSHASDQLNTFYTRLQQVHHWLIILILIIVKIMKKEAELDFSILPFGESSLWDPRTRWTGWKLFLWKNHPSLPWIWFLPSTGT